MKAIGFFLSSLLFASIALAGSTAMFKMDYQIKIGGYSLQGLESVTVDSSADDLSDKCTIVVPAMSYNKGLAVEDKLKRGDVVSVMLGYNGNLYQEFTGYLKAIYPNAPMRLECEDAIYLFRKKIADKQFKKTTANEILAYVLSQINPQLSASQKMKLVASASGYQFDKFTIVRATGFEVLQKLKQDTGLGIYVRGNQLLCQGLYTERRGNAAYDFSRNIEASEGLEYVRREDRKVLVKMIGRTKKGVKVEVEVGESGGDMRTIQRPNVSSKETLELIGKNELTNQSFDGYRGAIKGWLVPTCEIGYTASVFDQDYPERNGKYYVKAVKTEFSSAGGRRTISLGIKVS
ncbi:hypothetical protein [Spirosoma aerolatum]|uniref:hypothetical protein n=1 Tax=Spirosoma aerolatum TaxID=1211326 RepID=UPI0009AEA8BF|nr:hypothetical protein [Spirosoma aerolatum]